MDRKHILSNFDPSQRQFGFTLLEAMIVVALISIATAIAVPSFTSILNTGKSASQTQALVAAVQLARSEAVTRRENVSVAAMDNGEGASWTNGWQVMAGDEVLREFPELSDGSWLTGTDGMTTIIFNSSGYLLKGAAVDFSLEIDGCRGDKNRLIQINRNGRVEVSSQACVEEEG